ncbi:uncharacterized protein LOC144737176 [Lampetra planeri]
MRADLPENDVDPRPVEKMEEGLTRAVEVGTGTDNRGRIASSDKLFNLRKAMAAATVGVLGLREWKAMAAAGSVAAAPPKMAASSSAAAWRRLRTGLSFLCGVGESGSRRQRSRCAQQLVLVRIVVLFRQRPILGHLPGTFQSPFSGPRATPLTRLPIGATPPCLPLVAVASLGCLLLLAASASPTGRAASPTGRSVGPTGRAVMSFPQTLEESVRQAARLLALSYDTYRQYESKHVGERERHNPRNPPALACPSAFLPDLSNINHKPTDEVLALARALLRTWAVALGSDGARGRGEPLGDLVRLNIRPLLTSLKAGVDELLKQCYGGKEQVLICDSAKPPEQRGVKETAAQERKYGWPDVTLRSALLGPYDLLSCLKHDMHKVHYFLKNLECRLKEKGPCPLSDE